MTRTRRGAGGDDAGGSGSRGNGNEDLSPPPHPTPAKNAGHGRGRDQHQGPKPNQFSNFKDFLNTKPPIFKEVEEPLQTDEWLNTIKQKFRLLRVTEHLKAEYASH